MIEEQDTEKFKESLKSSLKQEEQLIEEIINPKSKKFRDYKENIIKLIELAKLNKITITL